MATQQAIIDETKIEAKKTNRKIIGQTRALLLREQEADLGVIQNIVATLSVQITDKLLQNEP